MQVDLGQLTLAVIILQLMVEELVTFIIVVAILELLVELLKLNLLLCPSKFEVEVKNWKNPI